MKKPTTSDTDKINKLSDLRALGFQALYSVLEHFKEILAVLKD